MDGESGANPGKDSPSVPHLFMRCAMSLSEDRLSNAEMLRHGIATLVEPMPPPEVYPPARQEIPGTLYVLQAPPVTAVKIGFTRGPVEIRVKSLQGANPYPLKVLAQATILPAGEFAVHRLLKEHRLMGEWFDWTPVVAAFVAALPQGIEHALDAAKSTDTNM